MCRLKIPSTTAIAMRICMWECCVGQQCVCVFLSAGFAVFCCQGMCFSTGAGVGVWGQRPRARGQGS
eukprot:1312163-Lingulodinium_polyedra.AAC.1